MLVSNISYTTRIWREHCKDCRNIESLLDIDIYTTPQTSHNKVQIEFLEDNKLGCQ